MRGVDVPDNYINHVRKLCIQRRSCLIKKCTVLISLSARDESKAGFVAETILHCLVERVSDAAALQPIATIHSSKQLSRLNVSINKRTRRWILSKAMTKQWKTSQKKLVRVFIYYPSCIFMIYYLFMLKHYKSIIKMLLQEKPNTWSRRLLCKIVRIKK